jgi:hypothetical protein
MTREISKMDWSIIDGWCENLQKSTHHDTTQTMEGQNSYQIFTPGTLNINCISITGIHLSSIKNHIKLNRKLLKISTYIEKI